MTQPENKSNDIEKISSTENSSAENSLTENSSTENSSAENSSTENNLSSEDEGTWRSCVHE